jgi:hypothetical protein
MYKVELWYSDGSENTFFENEKDTKEYMKVNRDSHMDIYFHDKLIYSVPTLLSYGYIDWLDFKTMYDKLMKSETLTFDQWKELKYGKDHEYTVNEDGVCDGTCDSCLTFKYVEYLVS